MKKKFRKGDYVKVVSDDIPDYHGKVYQIVSTRKMKDGSRGAVVNNNGFVLLFGFDDLEAFELSREYGKKSSKKDY